MWMGFSFANKPASNLHTNFKAIYKFIPSIILPEYIRPSGTHTMMMPHARTEEQSKIANNKKSNIPTDQHKK